MGLLATSPNARDIAADCSNCSVEFLLSMTGDEDIGALLDEQFCGS